MWIDLPDYILSNKDRVSSGCIGISWRYIRQNPDKPSLVNRKQPTQSKSRFKSYRPLV